MRGKIARVTSLGLGLVVAAGLLALVLATGTSSPEGALAIVDTPTNTPGPTPTPKPANDGNLGGIYDIIVPGYDATASEDGAGPDTCGDSLDNGGDGPADVADPDCHNKAVSLYHCISKLDHQASDNRVKIAAQCYADVNTNDPFAEPLNNPPGEGPDGSPGPPPPPPYTVMAPAKGSGTFVPGPNTITLTACFGNIGGITGPNIIAVVTLPNAKGQLAAGGTIGGSLLLYANASNAQCDADPPAPSGSPPPPIPVQLTRVTLKNGTAGEGLNNSAIRDPGTQWPDYDGDGCTDAQELDKTGAFKCGDDPFNGLDPTTGSPVDVSGNYSIVATAARADWDKGLDQLIPGFYYTCTADMQQSGKNVTARLYCYTDSPSITVNAQAAGGQQTCLPANSNLCGDGLLGAAPPGRRTAAGPVNLGDVDDQHAEFTGSIDNGENMLELQGCFEDRDGNGPFGHVHARAKVNLHTGHGYASIAFSQDIDDCLNNLPSGAGTIAISVVRQATKAQNRDQDSDGCPDKRELSDVAAQGGLRDPQNHYDYFNPTKDGLNRVDDILAVVQQYFIDDPAGNPDMKSQTDRTAILGGNAWNLGPPNGQQRVDDILAAVKQYFHDC